MKEKELAVVVKDLHKTFRLPLDKHSGIKQLFVSGFKRSKGYELQHVLKGVSFEIENGEFFGIVGRNGSGKSTLLKLLAGIYSPDSGLVQINGSLTPFIELGVGFNPELTGRENVFLNGALLGFSREEVEAMYDDIVEFAELDKFMDQRLKNYSSGMQVRLAFSIAIRAQSDILLLDEVLAVGDEAFQKKCYSYFDQLKRQKRTVILVTHDMAAVERFCTRALFLDEGEIKKIGKPHRISAEYSRSNSERYGKSISTLESGLPSDIKVVLKNSSGKTTNTFDFGEKATFELSWEYSDVNVVGVAIYREDGQYMFGPNTFQDGYQLKHEGRAKYIVNLNLNEGHYFLKIGLGGKSDIDWKAFVEETSHFTVKRDYTGGRWGGVTKLNYEWE